MILVIVKSDVDESDDDGSDSDDAYDDDYVYQYFNDDTIEVKETS